MREVRLSIEVVVRPATASQLCADGQIQGCAVTVHAVVLAKTRVSHCSSTERSQAKIAPSKLTCCVAQLPQQYGSDA